MKGRDIVVMGIQPWDIEIGSNCKNIASVMAKDNRVLYVNQPLDRKSRHAERSSAKVKVRNAVLQGTHPEIEKVSDNLWVLNPKTMLESANWLPDGILFDLVNRINNRRLASRMIGAIKTLGFADFILFNDSSMFLGQYMKELLNPQVYVYYMRDYLIRNPYWKKHGLRLEPRLISNADVVVNNSTLYTEYGLKYNPHSYMVGQGCEVDDYNEEIQPIKIPDDLAEIPTPRIGYVGFLSNRRLHLELLIELAEKKPEWSFVFVGPEDDAFAASRLHQLPNVWMLGSRKPEELPGYVKGFDVCLNPQRINDATIGNYPRKIDEYLAMGKPTVASSTQAMDYFSEYTYLGETPEDYLKLVELALKEDSPELQKKRMHFARSHTWENNVRAIYDAIDRVAKT